MTPSRSEGAAGNLAKITRPGGGGESDAAFTPSPPVGIGNVPGQGDTSPCVATLTLAHQTRIRNMYSADNATEGNMNSLVDIKIC